MNILYKQLNRFYTKLKAKAYIQKKRIFYIKYQVIKNYIKNFGQYCSSLEIQLNKKEIRNRRTL